jgi:hypothetical protein
MIENSIVNLIKEDYIIKDTIETSLTPVQVNKLVRIFKIKTEKFIIY